MVELQSIRVGNDLVCREGTRYTGFFTELDHDPFLAGVSRASTRPLRLNSVMDFGELPVLSALQDYKIFLEVIADNEQRERFNHGWSAAFALSTSHAFDQEADDERRHLVEETLEFFGYPLTTELADSSIAVARFMKLEEFTELQRGMSIFGGSKSWAENYSSNYNSFTNFDSNISGIAQRLMGVDPYEAYEPNTSTEGAAVVLADEMARRASAAFAIGYLSMSGEYSKDSVWG